MRPSILFLIFGIPFFAAGSVFTPALFTMENVTEKLREAKFNRIQFIKKNWI